MAFTPRFPADPPMWSYTVTTTTDMPLRNDRVLSVRLRCPYCRTVHSPDRLECPNCGAQFDAVRTR